MAEEPTAPGDLDPEDATPDEPDADDGDNNQAERKDKP